MYMTVPVYMKHARILLNILDPNISFHLNKINIIINMVYVLEGLSEMRVGDIVNIKNV